MATSIKEFTVGKGELIKVDPRKLSVEEGYNLRFDTDELKEANAELKGQIKAQGVRKPLEVELVDDKLIVRDGHRRLKVVLELIGEGVEIASVPAIFDKKGMTEEERVLTLFTSNSGYPLSPIEKGEGCLRLSKLGWSDEKIGAEIGLSYKQVENLITLAKSSKEVKAMVAEGKVSASTAVKTLKAEGKTAGEATLTAAVEAAGGAKVKPKAIAQAKAAAAPKAPPAPPPAALGGTPPAGAGSLSSLLGVNNNTPSSSPSQPETPAYETDADGNQFPRLMMTTKNFQELQAVLREILVVDDIKVAHIMVRDCLKVVKAAA